MSSSSWGSAAEQAEVRRNRSFSGFLSGRKRERAAEKPYDDEAAPTTSQRGPTAYTSSGYMHSSSEHELGTGAERAKVRSFRLWRSNSLLSEKEGFATTPAMSAGPGSIQVMPPELREKISAMQAATEALKGPRVSRSAAPSPMPLSPSRRLASEEDLRDKRATFRRRMSAGKGDRKMKRAESPSLRIEVVPGTFRKVSSIKEERDGLGSEILRTVEIRRSSGVPLGFNFHFLPSADGRNREAEVTDIQSGSVVDCQQLVQTGDRLVRINGVDVSTMQTEQDLRLAMEVVEKLTLTVRRSASGSSVQMLNKSFRSPSPPRFTGKRPYSPQAGPDPYVPGNGMLSDPLMINTDMRKDRLDDGECPYDEIEVYPLKEDQNRPSDAVDCGNGDFPDFDFDLGLVSSRSSIGLMEYMEGVMNVFMDKNISNDEKHRQLKEKMGLQLPSSDNERHATAEPPAQEDSCPTPESEGAPSSVEAERDTPPLEQDVSTPRDFSECADSTVSIQDDDTDDSYLEVHSEELGPSKSGSPLNGIIQLSLRCGSGFLSPGSELRCVISAGEPYSEVRSMVATVDRHGATEWDDLFEMDVDQCERLTVSCYTVTYDRRDRLCARGTVNLSQLFATGLKQRLHLSLTPRGSLVILFKFTERKRVLMRIPSDDQYFGTFGNTLQQVTVREGSEVPVIVTKLITEIERRGLRQLGLYCVSGSFKMKQALRDNFEADCSSAQLSEDDVPDVTIIAALLKEYLSQLPEPLLTHNLYEDLIASARHDASEDERRQRLFSVLQDMPEVNLDAARVLFRHFKRVLQNSLSNKLTTKALSTVMGPVLLWPGSQMSYLGLEGGTDLQGQADVIEAMLNFCWADMAYTGEETTF